LGKLSNEIIKCVCPLVSIVFVISMVFIVQM
jgi:hypothetical protein